MSKLSAQLSLNIKKLAAVILTAALCFGGFSGCAKKEEAPTLAESALKDYIYKAAEFVPKGENFSSVLGVAFDGSAVFMLATATEPGADGDIMNNTYLVKTDISGNVLDKTLLDSLSTTKAIGPDNALVNFQGISVGSDGTVYLLRRTVENLFAASPNVKMEIVSMSGETANVLVNIAEKLSGAGVEAASLYISDFAVDKDKIAYIIENINSVWAFDLSNGEVVFDNKPLPQGGSIKGLHKNADGEISVVTDAVMEVVADESGGGVSVVSTGDGTGAKHIITPIDIKPQSYGSPESISAPGGFKSNIAQGDGKYEYYGYSLSSIYGYNDGAGTLIADLLASGINLSDITGLIPVSDTQFLLTGYKSDQVSVKRYFLLTKVAPEDVPDKTIVTVAALTEDLYLPGYIAQFTASHPEFHVEYKLYAGDSGTSFDDALKAFNMDVITGNVPDVLLIDKKMAYGNYVDKGLFADLYPLIDKDPDYSREDFLAPFLKALETDGKLYSIAPAFSIDTLIGKTSVFGEKQGQTLAELEAAAAKITGASLFGTSIDRDYFVDGFLMRTALQFIDEEKGVCNFNSPEFISMLEYANSLPEPSPNAVPYMSSTWMPDQTGNYKEDRVLTEQMHFMVFKDIVAVEKMDFGEPITFLGYPNASGKSGIKALTSLETAIMASAKNPDGAWAFVKGLQTYSYPLFVQNGYPPLWLFPTLVSELSIAAQNATIPPFGYDDAGNRTPIKNWLGADLSSLPNNTEAHNAKMYALFDSIDGIRRITPAINDILKEETESLFTGG
jgi:hypothetical protein